MNMTLSDLWRQQYRVRRYLEFCTHDQLMDRYQVIMHNFFVYSPDGKVRPTAGSSEWSEVMAHLMMEYALRAQAMPTDVKGGMFNPKRYSIARIKTAAALFDKTACTPGTYLLKFGKLKYLRPLLEVGSLRVAPASLYDDKSLNFSVRDTELQFTQTLVGGTFRTPPNGNEAAPMDQWAEMPHIGHATMTTSSETNFYIACFGASYEYGLFDDFDANACLVIKDVSRFSKSMAERVAEALPGWRMSSKPVDYRDPYRRACQ